MEALEKKLMQLENELAATTTNLENSNVKLEEREKALQNVSHTCMTVHDHSSLFNPSYLIKILSLPGL